MTDKLLWPSVRLLHTSAQPFVHLVRIFPALSVILSPNTDPDDRQIDDRRDVIPCDKRRRLDDQTTPKASGQFRVYQVAFCGSMTKVFRLSSTFRLLKDYVYPVDVFN